MSLRSRYAGYRFPPEMQKAFATDELHVTYIFWGTQEPYFTRDVLPFLASR